jgi:monooxygenase
VFRLRCAQVLPGGGVSLVTVSVNGRRPAGDHLATGWTAERDGANNLRDMLSQVDVLIVGAGLSGIGAAHHLQTSCPTKTYAILEARDAIGGTWDLFRYPGIRSDSDMYTLGYDFRPWTAPKAIADGPSILQYIRDTADEGGITDRIRYGHRIERVSWWSEDQQWTASGTADGAPFEVTAGFVYFCTGYYDYAAGYTPDFPGIEDFSGQVVHPQHWPADLDYAGKQVVVIGSGATAVTLVPSMADEAGHVTMLQRSPTYVVGLPARDPLAGLVSRLLPTKASYTVMRWKAVLLQWASFRLSRRAPRFMRKVFAEGAKRSLPAGYPLDPHFTPTYDPWDQRLCVVPDGDLFKAISKGTASVVTDRIETFTTRGLRLASGAELEADLIVTATGLNLQVLGGAAIEVDGAELKVAEVLTYKGMMFSGIPNLALATGYTNASWTLKIDLVSAYLCRLLTYMDANGYASCTPHHPNPSSEAVPFLDLASGYVLRAVDHLPKQGSRAPWRLHQSYLRDLLLMKRGNLDDGVMRFAKARGTKRKSA